MGYAEICSLAVGLNRRSFRQVERQIIREIQNQEVCTAGAAGIYYKPGYSYLARMARLTG
jgi:hypothetical protein